MASDPRGTRLFVVGASAGGVEALLAFAQALPADLPCAGLVVLHISPSGPSVLADILGRASPVPVVAPDDGDVIRNGHLYVARPDLHLVAADGRVRLVQTPRENGHRPAIDPAMRSAAAAYGEQAAGVVLSGTRDDGTAGLLAVARAGGRTYAQDPGEALYPSMPRSAAAHAHLDAVATAAELARIIGGAASPVEGPSRPTTVEDAMPQSAAEPGRTAPGDGTRFTCPDCGGALFEHADGPLLRFECSVGHVFSIDSLAGAQVDALENALWAAVRSLEDRASMLGRLAERARVTGTRRTEERFDAQASEALDRASSIRDAIELVGRQGGTTAGGGPDAGEVAR